MWGWNEELLAQVIEEVSVLSADRRRKEPRTVKRPLDTSGSDDPSRPSGLVVHEGGGATAYGVMGMIEMVKARGGVAPPPPGEVTGG